jgi:ankyrin repeat protein
MNKFLTAVTTFNLAEVKSILDRKPEWIQWHENDGKNALHYICGVPLLKDRRKQELSLAVLKLLVKKGLDINSIQSVKDKNCLFPATPLWYAYARGRNEKLYKWLLGAGADPEHCMFAIAWYDDVKAATLFQSHGASLEPSAEADSPFLAAFLWKRFSVAEWFLKNGAAIDAHDKNGNTALYYAVKRKFLPDKIKLLLKYNPDIHSKNKEGISPYSLAIQKGPKRILHILEEYREKVG